MQWFMHLEPAFFLFLYLCIEFARYTFLFFFVNSKQIKFWHLNQINRRALREWRWSNVKWMIQMVYWRNYINTNSADKLIYHFKFWQCLYLIKRDIKIQTIVNDIQWNDKVKIVADEINDWFRMSYVKRITLAPIVSRDWSDMIIIDRPGSLIDSIWNRLLNWGSASLAPNVAISSGSTWKL